MDVANFSPKQMNTLRRVFHAMNHFMVWMWKMGWGKAINVWPAVVGRIMVIKHRGRRSGKEYQTPVNYARVNGDVYCLAGFGSNCDWYRNLLANPEVELRLLDGSHKARAEDASDSPDRLSLMRQVIIGSGFAGPLFGVDQRKMDDGQLDAATKDYRLVRFSLAKP